MTRRQGANIDKLLESLQLSFRNRQLLIHAFTHSSFVNEHKSVGMADNERLEFLGDAVLEVTVSEYLYHQYPDMKEGNMTKLRAAMVCEASLVKFAELLHFGDYVLLGKGEEMGGGRSRPALLADVYEAFIGALFLDQGIDAVRRFLQTYMFPALTPSANAQDDFKTMLQEKVQQNTNGALSYQIVEEQGPAHDRLFVSEVHLEGRRLGIGHGRSKKESEQRAAEQALLSERLKSL